MHALWLGLLLALPPAAPATCRLIDSRSGSELTAAELAERLAASDVVFLGEEHDNPAGHALQHELLPLLHERRADLVLSLEMFECDVQGALDDYLAGRIVEEKFIQLARPWKNYAADYRPLLEFAREHQLDVIAANVPREVAKVVSQGKDPGETLRAWLPRLTTDPRDAYWERFQAVMQAHAGTDDPGAMERYYRSQCLKDDRMAEAVTDYLRAHAHRRPLIVHVCGRFHSDHGQGTVSRVLQRQPLLRVEVVSTEAVDDPAAHDAKAQLSQCHYLAVVPKPPKPPEKVEEKAKAETTGGG